MFCSNQTPEVLHRSLELALPDSRRELDFALSRLRLDRVGGISRAFHSDSWVDGASEPAPAMSVRPEFLGCGGTSRRFALTTLAAQWSAVFPQAG